ncbi:MAG TPA: terminase small subunit [Stellaceae bacterium]|nr:terminase small subunit [Stellaceae bacterium]
MYKVGTLAELGEANGFPPHRRLPVRAASLATRSPRRPRSRSKPGTATRKRGAAKTKGATEFEDVGARAARLGITVERVLREYARIAFVDPRHIVEWDAQGLHVKTSEKLSEADVASVSEVTAAASGIGAVRVKLYDKKAALDAIARYLGMFPPAPKRREDDGADESAEDAREELARLVARLAPGAGQT